MVLIFFLLSGFILVPLTFSQSELPSCAIPCFTAAIEASGCTETDYECICTNSIYLSVGTCCVRARCDTQDLQTVWTESVDLCLSVGVTVTELPATACTSTYGVAASTGSATSGAVSSAITTSSSPTTTGGSSGDNNNNGSSDNATGKSGGLSTAASVGIGVGAGVVGLLLLGALVWFLIHYRKRSKSGEAQYSPAKMDDPPDPQVLYHKGELDGSQQQGKQQEKQHQSQSQPSSRAPDTIPIIKTPDDDYPTRPSTTIVATEDSLLEDQHQYSSVSAFELQTAENLHQRQDVTSDPAELSTHRRLTRPEPYELQ